MHWGPTIRPTRAEIDLRSVVENSRLVASWAGSQVMAVVKADAYGHGASAIALALEEAQSVLGFAVSLVEEGIELRDAGITLPILVMGPSIGDAYDSLVEFSLTPFLSDCRHIAPLEQAAAAASTHIGVHLKVDTGMGRLGIKPEKLDAVVTQVEQCASLRLEGIGSHLACADFDDPMQADSMTCQQLRIFREIVASLSGRKLQFHIANSDGIARFSAACFDFARPGIALYGNGARHEELSQSMRLVSAITQLRTIATGNSVSYGARWIAERESQVAIVPIGYADGLPRRLSGKGSALIAQTRCEILGTISMDMIVVDVTDCPQAQIGDEVVLLGRQGKLDITVSEVAHAADISEYEVTCGISKRVPRVFVNGSLNG